MKYAFFNTEGRVESAHDDDTVTDIPTGAHALTDDQWESRFDLMVADGVIVMSPLPVAQLSNDALIRKYEHALDDHMDSVARLYRYDSRFTFALRAGYVGPYQADAIKFAQWMDACNVQAFDLMGRVSEGSAVLPSIEAYLASFPEFK